MLFAGERTSLTALRAGVAAEGVADGTSGVTCHRPPPATPAAPRRAGVVESRGEKTPDIPAKERERGRRKGWGYIGLGKVHKRWRKGQGKVLPKGAKPTKWWLFHSRSWRHKSRHQRVGPNKWVYNNIHQLHCTHTLTLYMYIKIYYNSTYTLYIILVCHVWNVYHQTCHLVLQDHQTAVCVWAKVQKWLPCCYHCHQQSWLRVSECHQWRWEGEVCSLWSQLDWIYLGITTTKFLTLMSVAGGVKTNSIQLKR